MFVVTGHLMYLALSIGLTVWVAKTLHKNGRVFLVESFGGDTALADSVNHLLVVGFYLINIGYVALALKNGAPPASLAELIETLSTKVGAVSLVLGAMHFLNLAVFAKMRRHGKAEALQARAPLAAAP
jgi:hypothetical protein